MLQMDDYKKNDLNVLSSVQTQACTHACTHEELRSTSRADQT